MRTLPGSYRFSKVFGLTLVFIFIFMLVVSQSGVSAVFAQEDSTSTPTQETGSVTEETPTVQETSTEEATPEGEASPVEETPEPESTATPLSTDTAENTSEPLQIPGNFQVFSISETEVQLVWENLDEKVTHFSLERFNPETGEWAELVLLESSLLEYSDQAVECGLEYSYRIRAYDQVNELYSDYSSEQPAVMPLCLILEAGPTPTPEEFDFTGYERLVEKINENGSVRIIVQLDTQVQPEGSFRNENAVQAQRQAIHNQQERVINRLPQKAQENSRRFETIPYMAMEVDLEGLKELITSSEILNISEDSLVKPSLDLSVPLIGADNTRNAGYDGSGWT